MGAPPGWPGAPDEDVLETGRPLHRGVVPAVAALAVAVLATTVGVALAHRHPHPPVLVSAPTLPPPEFAYVRKGPVADVLVLSAPYEVESHTSATVSTYMTALRNETDRTLHLGAPMMRGPHLLALPGTAVALSPGRPRNRKAPVPRHTARRVAPHGLVTVTVAIWPSCSPYRDNISRDSPRKVDIIVPIHGYRLPATFTFNALFSGMPRPHVASCRLTGGSDGAK